MTNLVKMIDNPNSTVEVQAYNKSAGRIAEVVEMDGEYWTEYFLRGNGGHYFKQLCVYRTPTYACAVLAARRFAESGEMTKEDAA